MRSVEYLKWPVEIVALPAAMSCCASCAMARPETPSQTDAHCWQRVQMPLAQAVDSQLHGCTLQVEHCGFAHVDHARGKSHQHIIIIWHQ